MNANGAATLAQIVVSFRGTIVDVTHLAEAGEVYTVGEAPEASFKLEGAALPDAGASALVLRGERGAFIVGLPGFEGIEAGARVGLGPERLTLRRGELRFDISQVVAETAVTSRRPIDRPFWASVIGNGTLAALAFLLMRSIPDDGMSLALEDAAAEARFASYFQQADMPVEQETVEPEVEAETTESSEPTQGGGKRPGPRKPKAGGGNEAGRDAFAAAGGPKGAPGMARGDFDPSAAASNAGILGILAAQDQSFLASAQGAFGDGEADALLWASTRGLADYGVGSGLTVSNRAGNGGSDLVGMGDTGLLGTGTGSQGLTYGKVVGHSERTPKRVPVAELRGGTTSNNVDKDVVRRIVRAHINEVRGCYNAGLRSNPNLAGRVTVQFTIVGTGKVASAVIKQNTTRDSAVGDCIAKAVKRWKFPAVRGGGTALVSYPFQLRTR